MGSSSREEIVEVFDALDADLDRLCELSFDVFTTPERLRALERLERVARRLRAPQHALINQLDAQAGDEELGGTLRSALADRLRITKAEAGRRIDEAADLGERRALTGEPLAPQLSATAAAQRHGLIGDGHVKVIRSFFAHLPTEVDLPTREAADADLADKAGGYRPDELAKYAQRIMDWLNPDGEFSDEERARKRGITIGKQEYDGMSRISGYLTPEARATFEPVLAKLAAPGACNPDDETPVIDETPDEDAVRRDTRSPSSTQSRWTAGRATGPDRIAGSGSAQRPARVDRRHHHTQGSGSRRRQGPDRRRHAAADVGCDPHGQPRSPLLGAFSITVRRSRCITPSGLPRPAQRIMLYAKDRGCTKPGCDAPAYHSQVHHIRGWAATGRTDINDLTLACGIDNRLVEKGWTTRTNARGDTEWLAPAHLDYGQPRVNTFHHPEKLLVPDDDEDP